MIGNKMETSGMHRRNEKLCSFLTKCEKPRRSYRELMTSEWEEFVIRYDLRAGKYITRTACCPGAPTCC